MRRFVGIDVHSLNRLLHKRNIRLLADQQHIRFILKALAGDLQHFRDDAPREHAQTRLRITDLQAAEQTEHRGRQLVAEAALRRHMIKVKIPAPENQHVLRLLVQQIDAGGNVIRLVLVVAVDRHGCRRIRAVLHEPLECGFQRSALALVDLVMQHCTAECGALLEIMLIFRR